jgi:hypothetical protein
MIYSKSSISGFIGNTPRRGTISSIPFNLKLLNYKIFLLI